MPHQADGTGRGKLATRQILRGGSEAVPVSDLEPPLRKHLQHARLRSVRRLPLQTGIKQKRRVFRGAGQLSAGQLHLSLRFVARWSRVR